MLNTEESTPFRGVPSVPIVVPEYRDEDGKWFDRAELALAPIQWGMVALNNFKPVSTTLKTLPSGVYDITMDQQDGKSVFIKKTVIHDKLLPLSGLPSQITAEISDFWEKETDFIKLGFLHRRGYLLYGSHGCGKSSLVHQIVDEIVKEKGIVFYCENPKVFNMGLEAFRKIEPTRKVICVFEDVDAIIKKHGESELLSLLDGENQISRVVNIATTNYPELLDKRIVGRPRRFDRVYRIGNLGDEARRVYLKQKLPKGSDVKTWLKKTEGLSIASISEVMISVFCFGKNLDESVEIMQNLTKDKSSEEYSKKGGVGFDKRSGLDNSEEDDSDDDD